MESEIFDILECLDIETNVEQNYIKELVEIIKVTLNPLYKKDRYKLKPCRLKRIVYKFIEKKFNLSKKVINLSKIPQPEQRTKEWYEFRENRITASSAASIINMNPYSSRKQYLQDKLGVGKKFTGNFATRHGTKFEQIATTIYEIRNNLLIFEFGSIPHLKYDFIAASPDGISNGNEPVMLEIKCPPKREIKNDYIPEYYWVQMQLQLEVAELEVCDFLQMKIVDIDEHMYYNNSFDKSDKALNEEGLEKGFIIVCHDNDNKYYFYPNRTIISSLSKMEQWKNDFMALYSHKYNDIYINYWNVLKYSVQRVKRDKKWFEENLKEFKKFWDEVLFYRKNGIPDELIPKIKEPKYVCEILSSSDDDDDDICTILSSSISDEDDNVIKKIDYNKINDQNIIKENQDLKIEETKEETKEEAKEEVENETLNNEFDIDSINIDI